MGLLVLLVGCSRPMPATMRMIDETKICWNAGRFC